MYQGKDKGHDKGCRGRCTGGPESQSGTGPEDEDDGHEANTEEQGNEIVAGAAAFGKEKWRSRNQHFADAENGNQRRSERRIRTHPHTLPRSFKNPSRKLSLLELLKVVKDPRFIQFCNGYLKP
jgi:hypothetical protein